MRIVLLCMSLIYSWNLFSATSLSINCQNKNRESLFLEGTNPFDWLSGEDQTNPVDCLKSKTVGEDYIYFCDSYQGSTYMRFKMNKNQFNKKNFLLTLNYLDEDSEVVTYRTTLICKTSSR